MEGCKVDLCMYETEVQILGLTLRIATLKKIIKSSSKTNYCDCCLKLKKKIFIIVEGKPLFLYKAPCCIINFIPSYDQDASLNEPKREKKWQKYIKIILGYFDTIFAEILKRSKKQFLMYLLYMADIDRPYMKREKNGSV